MSLRMTASQTVGPFLHIGLLPSPEMAGPGVSGEHIVVEIRIVDGTGQKVTDGMVEVWQANSHGKYAHPDDPNDLPVEPGFKGYGRAWCDADGVCRFTTVKPGCVPNGDGTVQAPHLMISLFSRGLLKHLVTRMYFAGEAANAADPVLQQIPAERRETLMGKLEGGVARWTLVMQGANETVFFGI